MEEGILTKTKLLSLVLCALLTCTHSADTISANQTIRNGETIVSPQQTFELGFFKPGNSTNRYYVGIWYKKISTGTVVWVANRNTPLTTTSGELTLTPHGLMVLRTAAGNIVWSSANSSTPAARNLVARLLDTGNLIIHDQHSVDQENPIWQSFDFPTDGLLPGMKLGQDLVTGIERHFTSWKSADDPSAGEFSAWLDTRGYPQVILKEGQQIKFRAGPWNGLRFSGEPDLRPNPIYNFHFVLNSKEIYYQYNLIDTSVVTRVVLQPNGRMERLLWINSRQEWIVYLTPETDNCDRYAMCRSFGSCNIDNSPACDCLEGFEPTAPEQWTVADWSQGCRYRTPLDCGPGEGFKKYTNLKLPDTQWSRFNLTMNHEGCERVCKSNCSCTAYTSVNISGPGSGCLLWFGDLIDIRTFAENGDDLYIRLPPSELGKLLSTVTKSTLYFVIDSTENSESSSGGRRARVIVPVATVILVILVSICLFYRSRRKTRKREGSHGDEFGHDRENNSGEEDLELPLFGLSTLLKATNNFSINNILGEGGFGPVYKGVLENGQEIAVKRLAKTSTQGLHEFKNEVISISKLQHRNLVKLLGCCIEGAEKMLIYEYMPNKGLDSFIFDKTRSKLLDWPVRFHIIDGIARGLLYLHRDSRLRIIHRDLKVSNILLDSNMNPKISDFGMARSFGRNQIEANTNRVVGTYGYMAPEYAGHGIFSIKSDVYSFGVLVLEIVCGEKNRGFFHKEHSNNLIGHAWGLHKEGRSLQLVAKCLVESINLSQVLRSIHVGLLCVQRHPEDRPTMTSVILMLGSEGPLPSPKEPGFFIGKTSENTRYSSSTFETSSTNELSITTLNGR
ncbi:G-type lectin S-receptor-like serine/threonine-protein kinase At4g27290 isoform X2 [Cynara cardunculus var. scolymus]|uniref:G-type lectin S-receptor-like serine/threonine-protein kinase At4g27290 isoform X2 n=1 Tax=Cynara cardunculus var. scolymus TaxID=59895 RepID=UPI000D62A51D|nr:G-type lectin S-receptor-like serine/threonine-protein kinase At4g27290 isoform X2 [Cynara cardunculus var. scolymus]